MDTKHHLTTKEIVKVLLIVPVATIALIAVLGAMLPSEPTSTLSNHQPATVTPQDKRLTGIEATSVTQTKNVTAPRYESMPYTLEMFTADGENTVFLLRDSYDDVTIKVNGKIQVIGTHKEGQRCNNDACYNFDGKKFVFSQPPAAGATITFQGLPQSKVEALKAKEATRTWQTVKSWSGNSTKTTEPFTVSSSPWKAKWSSAGEYAIFQAYLFDAETNAIVEILANAHAGSDETFVYQSGTFYIKVNAANAQWSLAIQEKK